MNITKITYVIHYHDLRVNQWFKFQEMDSLSFDFQILYDRLQKEFPSKASINFRIIKVTETEEMVNMEKILHRHKKLIFMFIRPSSDIKIEE